MTLGVATDPISVGSGGSGSAHRGTLVAGLTRWDFLIIISAGVHVKKNKIKLRPIKPEDEEFLYQVYASTREEEMALGNWTKEQFEDFLRMQFNAQHKYYQENYTGSQFDIILKDKTSVGRLYVARWEKEIRIIDIALLTEYRRQGIGSMLLKDLMAEAAKDDKPVSIHVEHLNPTLRLYKKLGFRQIDDTGVYFLMEWEKNL